MDDQQQSRQWLTRKRVLWTVCIIVVIVGAYILLRFAYVREWKWTGLVKDPDYHNRTLWDWLNLLIVPAVLALGGYFFTRSESRRTQEFADRQRTLDREIADEQRKLDREIADQRRQDDMLQAYLDGMSQLLTDEKRPLHRAQQGDSLSTVARARTLTVLSRLDGERKGSVVQFLYDSGLIFKDRPVFLLSGSDLSGANLSRVNLSQASLREANLSQANLREANLTWADLSRADLTWAVLYGAGMSESNLRRAVLAQADLSQADLGQVNLTKANLSGANLSDATVWKCNLRDADLRDADLFQASMSESNLQAANLSESNLHRADLRWTNLSQVNLTKANLSGALLNSATGVTNERIEQQAKSLEGTTMPNGQKYEDWLKDREGGKEDEKNE